MKLKEYPIVITTHTVIYVEAENGNEAVDIALNDFKNVKSEIINSIDLNGYDADFDEGIMEEEYDL